MAFGGTDGPTLDRGVEDSDFAGPWTAPVAHFRDSALRPTFEPAARRSPFPEIDCVRDRLSLGIVAEIERRAIDLGIGAERVIIAAGILDEETYLRALARWLGWGYEDFSSRDRASCLLSDAQLLNTARTGLLPFMIDGRPVLVVAPRSVRQLLDFARRNPGIRFRLASSVRLNGFIMDHAADALGQEAADALLKQRPDLSAGHCDRRMPTVIAPAAALWLGALLTIPGPAIAATSTALAAGFLMWLLFRLTGCLLRPAPSNFRAMPEHQLPIYTIIVALYREADSVAGLVEALRALDYPPEKLDIKLVIEPYDIETWNALKRLALRTPFEIIVAPDFGPRTKPKALNAALPFAQGTFTVVYDAEDRPEPDQLRRAVAAFMAEDNGLACVQARLTIDNTEDGWLAQLFTAEYATQFDLFLPGLARIGLPLTLGGSSNHFLTEVLRRVGAWDSYNVTEDADLGMRLARFGYRATVIESSTYEEAPARFAPWLCQRTRWFKGWLQTWLVHMRHPLRLWRELGTAGFLTFQLVAGGSVLAALVHPLFFWMFVYAFATDEPLVDTNGTPTSLVLLFGTAWAAGYLVTIFLALRGLARRELLSSARSLVFVWVHWLMLSLAAWRAVIQLVHDPHRWEKTEHGLAKSSRLAKIASAGTPRAVLREDGLAARPEARADPLACDARAACEVRLRPRRSSASG
jgi:cellulose synthase/poly-beta-1,6-N-acetylglucosamine synthase-like glycosyltransferase